MFHLSESTKKDNQTNRHTIQNYIINSFGIIRERKILLICEADSHPCYRIKSEKAFISATHTI